MHKILLTKIFLIISLFATKILIPMDSALGGTWDHGIPLQFKPLTQPDDPILTKTRSSCTGSKEILTLFPKNVLLEKAGKGTRPGVCYNAAMKEVLGLSKIQFQTIEQSIVGLQDWVTIIGMPYKFFDQQEFPHKGNLVTYTPKNSNFIKHFGVVTENNRIKSKMGTSKYTVEHDYWELSAWGKDLYSWKLRKIYDDQNGKNQLFSEIMDIIQNSPRMELLLQDAQKTLFALAANKNGNTLFSRSSVYNDPYHLIKGIVGLKIDLPNHCGETALMIASKKGNLELVTLLLEHHANRCIKNKKGQTALDLAQQNKHYRVVNALDPYPRIVINYYSLITLTLTLYYLYNCLA
jgi:hypothetical protein